MLIAGSSYSYIQKATRRDCFVSFRFPFPFTRILRLSALCAIVFSWRNSGEEIGFNLAAKEAVQKLGYN